MKNLNKTGQNINSLIDTENIKVVTRREGVGGGKSR